MFLPDAVSTSPRFFCSSDCGRALVRLVGHENVALTSGATKVIVWSDDRLYTTVCDVRDKAGTTGAGSVIFAYVGIAWYLSPWLAALAAFARWAV